MQENELPKDSSSTKEIQVPLVRDKKYYIPVSASIFISLFWIVFVWHYWTNGVDALGFNATVYGFLVLVFFAYVYPEKNILQRKNFFWLIPILCLILSFSLFENPFLKSITSIISPLLFAFFYNYSLLKDKEHHSWNQVFIMKILQRIFTFIGKLFDASSRLFEVIIPGNKVNKAIVNKILLGTLLFLAIAFVFVIPLLSSADPLFGEYAVDFMEWITDLISFTTIRKILFMFILSVLLLSFMSAWTKEFEFESKDTTRKLDDIIAGIVLGGIFVLYFFFLILQIGQLWVDKLPVAFEATETLVKSGFWQLLFLSIMNILFFFAYYRNTKPFVQKILVGFTFASLLLLLSAAQRMYLYVFYYGLSYEKFFASYTVLYCVILFIWLIIALFRKNKADIIKFVLVLFLWMYSLVTIFPVEQTIFKTNITLSHRADTRIELQELRMLSADVLQLVKHYIAEGVLNADKWSKWQTREEQRIEDKAWYELNVGIL